jgi:hypothetical protein
MTPPHIPDDELHAYLDQALPRSRCVVIESHLAACIRCRLERDAIAGLRDRTTHLLATLRPVRRRIPPSYEELGRRVAALPPVRRAPGWRAVAWAASLVGALGLGWAAREARAPADAGLAAAGVQEAVVHQPARHAETVPAAPRDGGATLPAAPAGIRRAPAAAPAAPARLPAPDALLPDSRMPAALEVSSDTLPSEVLAGDGLWRTVPWTEAHQQAGAEPPRVTGVPVVQVQVQPSRDSAGALTVVAQQLHSGEMITTIEGPVDDVWALLSRRGDAGDTAAQTVQHGGRLLAVTGQLPPDSLRAMVRRVNAASRVR